MIIAIKVDVYPEAQNPNGVYGLRDPFGLADALAEWGEIVTIDLIEGDD